MVENVTLAVLASIVHYPQEDDLTCSSGEVVLAANTLEDFGLELIETTATPSLVRTTPRPTTDYSRYANVIGHIHGSWLDLFSKYIQIAGHKTSNDLVRNKMVADDMTFTERIERLLLYRGASSIQRHVVQLRTIQQVLPLALAGRLSSLRELVIDRGDRSQPTTKEQIQNLIDVLERLTTAFPHRKLTHSFVNTGWDVNAEYEEDPELARTMLWAYHEPTVPVLEAFPPRKLDISHFPFFYKRLTHLDPSQLVTLHDICRTRDQTGEISLQSQFLKKCKRLTALNLYVFDPTTFSWATSDQDKTLSTTTPKIEILHLFAVSSSVLLEALDIAIAVLNHSLRFLWGYCREEKPSPLLTSSKLHSWDLPFVNTITIRLGACKVLPEFGALNHCPSLTTLTITGPVYTWDMMRKDEKYSVTRWHAPNLKILKLDRFTALLFDFDTFVDTPKLEVALISSFADNRTASLVQRLWAHCALPAATTSATTTTMDPQHLLRSQERWIKPWNLHALGILELWGPSSLAFSFSQLKGCPNLKQLKLSNDTRSHQSVPLSWNTSSETGTSIDPVIAKPLLHSALESITLESGLYVTDAVLTKVLADYVPNLVRLKIGSLKKGQTSCGRSFVEAIRAADQIQEQRGRQSKLLEVISLHTLSRANKNKLQLVRTEGSAKAIRGCSDNPEPTEYGFRTFTTAQEVLISTDNAKAFKAVQKGS
ncbi:hypothetical protein BGZ94_007623 [Podila epigama]|nr:hypothetical protein BGZ94_007623 [Podila epigama]